MEDSEPIGQGQIGRHNENAVITKLRNQLEFYLGDANLTKDQFMQRKLENSTQIDLALFLDFNRVKTIFGLVADRAEQIKLL